MIDYLKAKFLMENLYETLMLYYNKQKNILILFIGNEFIY